MLSRALGSQCRAMAKMARSAICPEKIEAMLCVGARVDSWGPVRSLDRVVCLDVGWDERSGWTPS